MRYYYRCIEICSLILDGCLFMRRWISLVNNSRNLYLHSCGGQCVLLFALGYPEGIWPVFYEKHLIICVNCIYSYCCLISFTCLFFLFFSCFWVCGKSFSFIRSIDFRSHYNYYHHVVPPAGISLTLSRHIHSSLLVGPEGYIPYPHRPAVCRFELVVLLLLGHVKGSIGANHLWSRPYFSSSVLHVWFV